MTRLPAALRPAAGHNYAPCADRACAHLRNAQQRTSSERTMVDQSVQYLRGARHVLASRLAPGHTHAHPRSPGPNGPWRSPRACTHAGISQPMI
jgi:hypothetical protein